MFLAKKLNRGAGTPAAPVDAQFKYVTMLLHGDGTNGAQNNTFLDSSSNTFTITRNGNTTQGSFSPYGSNWSNYFDGSTDYLQAASNSAFALPSDFTLEMWMYPLDWNKGAQLAYSTYPGTAGGLMLGKIGADFCVRASDTANQLVFGAFPTLYEWTHVVAVRSGNTLSGYFNGIRVATTTNSFSFVQSALTIGSDTQGSDFTGYLSNVRLVKGTAVYDPTLSTLTVPTAPLTAISGTSVLTCQSNRFVDNSTNAFAITVTGNSSVQRFNPFNTATAYDSSVIGGSAYLDGAGDYLSLASNSAFTVGTGDLTIEAWIYATSTSSYQGIISGRLQDPAADYPGLGLVINAGAITFTIFTNTARLDDTTSLPQNQWTHVVGVRSGTNMALFVNGVRKASSTNSENGTSSAMNLGRFYPADNAYYFNGYISNARLVKGTAVYDPTLTTLTVPTAPLTAVSGTSLLTRMINGAIFDNAMMNDLETVGNAQISTSVVKYGTGSMAFDGTGDYLKSPQNQVLNFGTGNFTVEFWANISSGQDQEFIVDATSGGFGMSLYNGSVYYEAWGVANFIAVSYAGYYNAWTHIAVTRNNGTARMFFNGIQVGSINNTTNFSTSGGVNIGGSSARTRWLLGYLDDLRITNGYARYTANFTAPTEALLDTGPY